MKKLVIPLFGDEVAPRFDLSKEILIVDFDDKGLPVKERIVVLPHAGSENLCHLILTENADGIITGGIEDEYCQYLTWKRIHVFDSVGGQKDAVLKAYQEKRLDSGMYVKNQSEKTLI